MADSKRLGRYLWPLVMICGVAAIYLPPNFMDGDFSIFGRDFIKLHRYRIAFAQEHLANGTLPGWYPRELCGTPFWANAQNFPWIPTRLVLLWLDPLHLFTAGVQLGAILAAVFTYLFARRLAIIRPGAAVAGWTFAASGFYASRVWAGHLPLLEAFPALPLMLWLVDRACNRGSLEVPRNRFNFQLAWIGLASAAVSLAGHPQLSIYALGAAAVYCTIIAPWTRWFAIGFAMACGVGIAMFSLLPFSMLVAKSTRVLPLDVASNDLPLPYERMLAALFPWRDGVPYGAPGSGTLSAFRFPHAGYFWDTVSYVGWWPWIGLTALLIAALSGVIRFNRRVLALALICVAALALSLPWARELTSATGGTFLRSPARLLYIVTLGLSLSAGGAFELLARLARRTRVRTAVAAGCMIVLAHAWDLSRHSRVFVAPARFGADIPQELAREIITEVADGRAAIDLAFDISLNRQLDDVSFFDSIMLARSYQGVMAAQSAPPGYNNQEFPASALNWRTLRICGAKVLVTPIARRKEEAWRQVDSMLVYKINDAAPRVEFFPVELVRRGDRTAAEAMLRDAEQDPTQRLIVEDSSAAATTHVAPSTYGSALGYRRINSDSIEVTVDCASEGYVKVLESYDSGWTATLDGRAVRIVPANLMFIAVRLPPGRHVLELRYSTPGHAWGIALSVVSVVALAAFCFRRSFRRGEA